MRKAAFAPVVDANTRLLILGSLPGDASLRAGQYYGHPQNAFWRLMGTVVGEDLHGMAYEARLATLARHRVGVWDVIEEAERRGSLDTAIRNVAHNDLAALVETLPNLRAVAFNGGRAAKTGMKLLAGHAERLALIPLPSSSPALTAPFAVKAQAWSVLKDYL